jgi:hypothetical protein
MRKTEEEICHEFLDRTFKKSDVKQMSYMRSNEGTYKLAPKSLPYPLSKPDASVRNIFDSVDGAAPMREIFRSLKLETTFQKVNHARTKLATSAFPYLHAT